MFLAIDIGNSSITCGLFDESELVSTFEMAADRRASAAAYRHSLRSRLEGRAPTTSGISSVVPELTDLLVRAVRDDFMVLPTVIDSSLQLPIVVDYDPVDSLGADRLCAAAAAHEKFGLDDAGDPRPVIVVDAGTAVTYEVVYDGAYRGGAIGPGPVLMSHALAGGTSQLGKSELSIPSSPLGRNTIDALRSGIMFGFLDSVSSMIDRLEAEHEGAHFIVATGGWGSFLADRIDEIDLFAPNLVLDGIEMLAGPRPK